MTWKIFLGKLYTKYGADTGSKLFSKNQNWADFWLSRL